VCTPTDEAPFSLAYSMEEVILVEVGSSSFRVSHYNLGLNDEGIALHLDLLQERRDEAQVSWVAYQRQVKRCFDKTVCPINFQVGDWVLKRASLTTRDRTDGKLEAKWEGPYRVVRCHKKGAYHLATEEGTMLPRAWNAVYLKKYYV